MLLLRADVILSVHFIRIHYFLITFFFFLTASCKGRCGSEYNRAYMCQCDYSCLVYGECCPDYEYQCTTSKAFTTQCTIYIKYHEKISTSSSQSDCPCRDGHIEIHQKAHLSNTVWKVCNVAVCVRHRNLV